MLAAVVLLLCISVFSSGASAVASTWKIVDVDYTQIAMSCSFQTNESGWIAGASDDGHPLLFHTDDGHTLQVFPVADATDGALMSISMFDGQHGLAGALGFAGLPCGVYTNDGLVWHKIHDGVDILCAVQDTKAPGKNVYIMIGEFSHPSHLGGDGVQISVDGGNSWTMHNWKQVLPARYGWFLNEKIGYLTGGEWPDNDTRSRVHQFPRQISHHIHHDGKKFIVHPKSAPIVDGYQGIIALTVDAGNTWKPLVNWTSEGVYFNEISCTDQMNCWVVGEGINKTTGTTAAYIYGTTDGFKTIKQQYYFEHGSLIGINMYSPTYGWAVGADMRSGLTELFKGAFLQTQDGKTWTMAQEINNFYGMDASTVNKDYAYCAGLNELTLADLAQYAPH